MGTQQKGVTAARREFSALLDAAERGQSIIVTRRSKPVAALVPIRDYKPPLKQASIISLRGSGRGYWGKDSTKTLRKLRDEWERQKRNGKEAYPYQLSGGGSLRRKNSRG